MQIRVQYRLGAAGALFAMASGLTGCATAQPAGAALPSTVASQGEAEAAAADFLSAFNAMDLERFRILFAEDASVFFPSAPFPLRRIEGRDEVLQWFGRFFESARARTARLNIAPQDLRVQTYGRFAVATFHLGGNVNVGRRTLVLRRDRDRWRIVHLHASSVAEQPPATAQSPNG